MRIRMDITKKFFTRNSESEVTMRIGIAGFAVVFFLIAGASPALCASDSASLSRDSTRHRLWAQLNLTEDQKAKLKGMRSEMREFRKQNFEKMKALLDKSKEELLKPSPSKTVLYGYAKEMGELHKAMSEHMANHMLTIKSVLTKEQFAKLLSNEFHPPMGGGHTGSHDGPPAGAGHRADSDDD